jgi:hypothetical protein
MQENEKSNWKRGVDCDYLQRPLVSRPSSLNSTQDAMKIHLKGTAVAPHWARGRKQNTNPMDSKYDNIIFPPIISAELTGYQPVSLQYTIYSIKREFARLRFHWRSWVHLMHFLKGVHSVDR